MIQVPDGWEIKPLKSIGTCKNGLTYSPDDIVENGGLLVLRSSNIQNSQIALEDNVFVREDIKLNYKVQENDILVCVRNGSKDLIGKNALITKEVENMAHGAFMTVFHSKINKYIFQIFQSDLFFKQVEKNLGATINSINNSDLLLFEFPFPKEKKEQEKIAKILSTLDNAIESTNRIIEKEKNIKTALMQELLTNGIDKNGQIRTPQTHIYKQSELGLIPDEWEVVSLENIGNIITGNTPPTDNEEYYNGNIPFIGPVDFVGQKYIIKAEKTVSKNGLNYSREIPIDSILTVCIGSTIGKIALAVKQCCTNQQINALVCNKKYFSEFVFYAMCKFLQRQLDVEAGLQAVPIVNKSSFSKLVLPCPLEIEEQKQITKILTTQDKKIEREETNLSKLKELKKGLMIDLLSGNVRVKVC